MQPIKIGISGKMGSGKSIVAGYLVQQFRFTELAFADKLKEVARELFNVRAKDARGRATLQQLGATLREIDSNVWVRYVVNRIPPNRDVVVSDVRYPNEFRTLQELGFFMVRMYVSPEQQKKMVFAQYGYMPPFVFVDYSEIALDNFKFDAVINNDAGVPLAEVYKQAKTVLCAAGVLDGTD